VDGLIPTATRWACGGGDFPNFVQMCIQGQMASAELDEERCVSSWEGGGNFLESWRGGARVNVSCVLESGGFCEEICCFSFEGFEVVLYGCRFAGREGTPAVCW